MPWFHKGFVLDHGAGRGFAHPWSTEHSTSELYVVKADEVMALRLILQEHLTPQFGEFLTTYVHA